MVYKGRSATIELERRGGGEMLRRRCPDATFYRTCLCPSCLERCDASLITGQIQSNHTSLVWCLKSLTRKRTRNWKSSRSAISLTRRARSSASSGSIYHFRYKVARHEVLLHCISGGRQRSGWSLAPTTHSTSAVGPCTLSVLRSGCSRTISYQPPSPGKSQPWLSTLPLLPSPPSSDPSQIEHETSASRPNQFGHHRLRFANGQVHQRVGARDGGRRSYRLNQSRRLLVVG